MPGRLFATLFLLLALALPAFPAPQPVAPQAAPQTAPAPVVLDGTPLFHVRERVLSLEPAERARLISERLARYAKDPTFRAGEITVVDSADATDIAAGDRVIMSVTDQDARAEGTGRQALAQEYARRIRAAIEGHRERFSREALLLAAGKAILATAVLVGLLLLFTRLFPRLYARVRSWEGTRIRPLRIQSLEIMSAERIAALLIGFLRWVRLILTVLLFYFYVPLVFSFFPWTRGFAQRLLDYLVAPFAALGQAVADYLPKFFFLLVIVAVTHYALKLIRLFFDEVGKGTVRLPGFYEEWAEPTFKIVRFLVIAFAAVVAFPYLPGSDSPAFRGISIFLGVLFSLGSTSAIANIVAGVILTYTRGFQIGDRVKIAETVGDVIEKTLLVTHVRTIKNVDVTIPNSMVLGSHVINYSSSAKEYGLILHTSVTIGYDAPWRTIHELLIAAAKATEHILELPEPFVLQTGLNDFYVTYELNAYTDRSHKMVTIYSELHRNIQDAFNGAGVEIMSPHYTQVRDGNTTTIPEEYRPPGYVPPRFGVDLGGRKEV